MTDRHERELAQLERLAAYAAGDLDVDARREVDAQLARDPMLAAKLEALEADDAALRALGDVEPPIGFVDRVLSAVWAELDGVSTGEARPTDLAVARSAREARREARRTPWAAIAGAAAVLVAITAGIRTLGDASDTAATAGGESAPAEDSGAILAAPPGPVIVASGRRFDQDSLGAVASDVTANLGEAPSAADGEALALSYQAALLGSRDGEVMGDAYSAEADPQSAPEGGARSGPTGAGSTAVLSTDPAVSSEDLLGIRRCLPDLIAAAPSAIPAYVELVTFEGEPAILYGLVTADPDTGRYERTELWVVGREDCHVLSFTQP